MTRLARQRLTFALLVTALLFAVGCQQRETQSQYEQKLGDIHQARQQAISQLAEQSGDARHFSEARAAVLAAVEQMSNITPPSEVEVAHRRYIDSLRGMAGVLGTYADCSRRHKGDPAAVQQCRAGVDPARLDQIENDFSDARAIYRQHGYELSEVEESGS